MSRELHLPKDPMNVQKNKTQPAGSDKTAPSSHPGEVKRVEKSVNRFLDKVKKRPDLIDIFKKLSHS